MEKGREAQLAIEESVVRTSRDRTAEVLGKGQSRSSAYRMRGERSRGIAQLVWCNNPEGSGVHHGRESGREGDGSWCADVVV